MVRIPSEYQEVEYIESTGTQYINLPFGFLDTDEVEIVGSIYRSYQENDRCMLAPSVWNNNSNRFFILGLYNSYFTCALGNISTVNRMNPKISDEKIHKWTYKNKIFEVYDGDDVIASGNLSSAVFNEETNVLRLFYGYNSNTKGKIAYYHHKKVDGTEVNFIPCYRISDSEPGMYDTVSKTFYTNSGTGTFLVGNDVSWDTASLLERRRQILLNTPHIETVSDTIASFKTDVATKLKGCKIHFTPIQEGEGDPSPDNVRPIHGWDGVTVTACGKNLYNRLDGKPAYIPLKKGTVISARGYFRVIMYDAEMTQIQYASMSSRIKAGIILNKDVSYIGFEPEQEGYDYQIELGSIATDYEPYNATTLTIPFNRTIYGGYVDLVKGEVVEEWTKRNLNAFSQTIIIGGGFQVGHWLSTGWEKKNGVDNFISDVFKRVISGTVDQTMKGYGNTYPILLYDSSITTGNEFKEKYADNYIVYAIRHPNTYPIDPQTLKALRGMNNIWSDANGNIEISYYTH